MSHYTVSVVVTKTTGRLERWAIPWHGMSPYTVGVEMTTTTKERER